MQSFNFHDQNEREISYASIFGLLFYLFPFGLTNFFHICYYDRLKYKYDSESLYLLLNYMNAFNF